MNPSLAAMLDALLADGVYVGGGVIFALIIILLIWLIFFRGR